MDTSKPTSGSRWTYDSGITMTCVGSDFAIPPCDCKEYQISHSNRSADWLVGTYRQKDVDFGPHPSIYYSDDSAKYPDRYIYSHDGRTWRVSDDLTSYWARVGFTQQEACPEGGTWEDYSHTKDNGQDVYITDSRIQVNCIKY